MRKSARDLPVGIFAPFVGRGTLANRGVLVEGEEIFVLQDAHIGLAEVIEARANDHWTASAC